MRLATLFMVLGFLAVWGVYNAILLYRTLSKKTLKDPEQIIKQVQELCQARKFPPPPPPPPPQTATRA